jgi:hypothetical protein
MGFKMLILLVFFTVKGGLFIHSDIHRSIVNRVDYSVQIAGNRTVAQARPDSLPAAGWKGVSPAQLPWPMPL